MAVTYPYALSVLADRLRIATVSWHIKRNDELSGIGSGQVWQAELASPLWMADIALAPVKGAAAEQVAALVRKLHGSQEQFLLYHPCMRFPQADPTGAVLGAATVQINSISANRDAISLKGLPAGYTLTLADKMSVAYGSSPVRYAFLEASENAVANGSGVTPEFAIFPHVPAALAANLTVVLKNPSCKMFIPPDGFSAPSHSAHWASGMTIRALQKK